MFRGLPPIVRHMVGLVTVGMFGAAAAVFYESSPLVAGVLGILAVYRLIALVRSWAAQGEDDDDPETT